MTSEQHGTSPAPEMTPSDWTDLLDSIEQQKCLVVCGPEIFSTPGEPTLDKRLADHLRKKADQLRIRVYENGWFHLQPLANETSPYRQVKAFYQQTTGGTNGLLNKLTRVKFPIYISLTPDNCLQQAFGGYSALFDTYVRNKPYKEEQASPTGDKPLVYQLLGNLENRNSLILTYDDFYSYLESIFKGNSMSPILKDAIFTTEYFLFLGIPFDKWYMHLFMRVLRQSKEKRKAQKMGVPYNETYADSCLEQYTIRFVENDISIFVNELLIRCEKHQKSKKLLHTKAIINGQTASADNQGEPFFSELTEMLENNHLNQVYDKIKNVLIGTGQSGRELLQNFIQLKGRFSKLEEENTLGLLLHKEYHVELAKIRKAFLEMIDELRHQWSQLDIQL